MNFRPLRRPSSLLVVACLALTAAVVSSAQTSAKSGLASKLFVAEVTGESQIDTGTKIERLVKNSTYSPEGSVVETQANATDSLVLSNGTALYLTPETRIEVKRFIQEPFAPNRADLDTEPSVSQTLIRLTRGTVGVCTAKLVAGSTMVYQTPQASINVRGRRIVIQTTETETRVSLLEGDVTVTGEGAATGQVLAAGQQAIIRRASPDAPVTVTVHSIPAAESEGLSDAVSLACLSRTTVFFESVENPATGATELVPVRTVAADAPVGFTVSPARING